MSTGSPILFGSGNRGKKQKDYSHPSVVALIHEAGGNVDPYEIVREKCRALAQAAKKASPSWNGPPYCPLKLASWMGIKVRKVSHDIGAEARIYGTREGVRIEYRPDLALEERLRFSLFHEIAHTVFPDCFQMVRHSQVKTYQLSEAEKEFERICDVGAGELLLPHEDILSDLNSSKFTLHEIFELKSRYKASIEAAVKRCLDLTQLSRAAVFFNHQNERLTVKFYWKSSQFRPFIPPGFVPPVNSVIHALPIDEIESQLPSLQKVETWFTSGRTNQFQVQAIALPQIPNLQDYPRVMALITH